MIVSKEVTNDGFFIIKPPYKTATMLMHCGCFVWVRRLGDEIVAKDYAKQFYSSKQWLRCRDAYINSVHGLCERCLNKDRYTPGYIVHHKIAITPDNIHDPSITLDHDNLEYLCLECHNYTHFASETNREDLIFNDDGELVKR